MKCLRITLQRMASRTSIQSKLRPTPGRSPRPRRSKCRQIMRRHAIRFTCIRSGRATFSQPCSPAPTRRSSRARFAAVHESGSGPGCVKTRGRSIAIEQLSRSRPFDVPALRAHSISWPNTKISFSSRFGILSFHTAWARCRPRPRSPLASVARGEAGLLCSLRDIPSLTRSCENSKARRTARMIFSGSSENLSRFAVWPLKKGPKRIICSIAIKRLSVFTRPGRLSCQCATSAVRSDPTWQGQVPQEPARAGETRSS